MTHVGTRTALAVSGAILVTIGSWLMAAPTIFLATSEVIVEHDAGLMSEVTAPSGLLIIAGAFMMISTIKLRLARLGLGLGRLVSTYLHGTPSESLVVVMYFELAIAVLLLALNFKTQSVEASKPLGGFDQEVPQ